MNKIKVSVIIPTFNRNKSLLNTIRSLKKQKFSNYEIIVVDNACLETTKNLVENEMKRIERRNYSLIYIREKKAGLHNARHMGAKIAKSEILLYGDDDIIADEDWLEQIYTCYNDNKAAAVGGRIVGEWKTKIPPWFYLFGTKKNCGALSLLDLGEGTFSLPLDVSIYGCNFSIRKQILLNIGGFNPDSFPKNKIIFRGDGESGLIRKLRKKNYKILYTSKAIVKHVISSNRLTPSYFFERSYREGVSKAYSLYRHNDVLGLFKMGSLIFFFLRYFFYFIKFFSSNNSNLKIFYKSMQIYHSSMIIHMIRISRDKNLKSFVLKNDYINEISIYV
ncbi:MAG: glycosyltransferase family 2 protein [Candidatus Hodarchaeota archaeon]